MFCTICRPKATRANPPPVQLNDRRQFAHRPGAEHLIGAIELSPISGEPTKRAFSCFVRAWEKGFLIRTTGDIIALSPPLIISKAQIDELIDGVRAVLREVK